MKNTSLRSRNYSFGKATEVKYFTLVFILVAGFIFISPATTPAQTGKAAVGLVRVIAGAAARRAATKAAASAAARRAAQQAAARRAAANNSRRISSRSNTVNNRNNNSSRRYDPSRTKRPPNQRYERGRETVVNYCNYTGEPTIYVAIGYLADYENNWISRGWFQIANGTCKSVSVGMNYQGYVYQYAVNQDSDLVWKGNHNFYVNKYDAFTLRQNNFQFGYNENYKTVGMSEFRVVPGTNNFRFR